MVYIKRSGKTQKCEIRKRDSVKINKKEIKKNLSRR